MAGLDLSTRAGALRFAELRREELRRKYEACGKLERDLTFWVFATYAWSPEPVLTRERFVRRGPKLDKVTALTCPIPQLAFEKLGLEATRFAGRVISELAKATAAVGVFFVMESWGVDVDDSDEVEERPYGWIGESPERFEALYASLEHVALPQPWRWATAVHRDPLRVDPWKGGELKQADSRKSRLAGFIDWRS